VRRALQLAMSCIATVHRRFALQGSNRASDQLQFRVLGGRLLARQRLTDWRQIRPTARPTSVKPRAVCRGQDCADFPATSYDSQSKPTKFLHFLRQHISQLQTQLLPLCGCQDQQLIRSQQNQHRQSVPCLHQCMQPCQAAYQQPQADFCACQMLVSCS